MRIAVVATLALMSGCAGLAQQRDSWSGIRDAAQVPQIYVDAYREGDAGRIASLFAPEATFIPLLPMPRFKGPEAVRAYYQHAISSTRSRSITASNESVQDYGDVIVRTADVVIEQTFQDGRTAATHARVSFVYRRDRDSWRIVHHHQSVRPPTPAATSGAASGSR